MGKIQTSDELFVQLRKIIDLPENIISLDLRLSVDEIPTVIIKSYTKEDSLKGVDTITQKFKIVEFKNDKT